MITLDVHRGAPLLDEHSFQHLQAFPIGLVGQDNSVIHKVTPGYTASVLLLHVIPDFTTLFVKCETPRERAGGVANVGYFRASRLAVLMRACEFVYYIGAL